MTDTGTNIQTANEELASWFQTYSGIRFYPWRPSVEMISIIDIAHHTALTNRWSGATSFPISVAQHQVACWKLAKFLYPDAPAIQKWALFHDSAEAYVMDLVRPIKKFIPEFQAMEKAVLRCIHKKFDLIWPMPEEVKRIDNLQLALENQFAVKNTIPGLYEDLYSEFVKMVPERYGGFWFIPDYMNHQTAEAEFLAAAAAVGVEIPDFD